VFYSVLQCVAVLLARRSFCVLSKGCALRCVAVCCSVLQCFWLGAASVVYEGLCVVACCSELQCAVVSCSVFQYPACVAAAFAFCEKLCVALCCSVL